VSVSIVGLELPGPGGVVQKRQGESVLYQDLHCILEKLRIGGTPRFEQLAGYHLKAAPEFYHLGAAQKWTQQAVIHDSPVEAASEMVRGLPQDCPVPFLG